VSVRPPKVLILTADVGEGHVAAGRALGEGLRELGAEVVERDGLRALGLVARRLIRDGYRVQLRVAPWTYAAMYRLFMAVAPLRALGAAALGVLGRRRLAAVVARAAPDVVVSTHPALTCVLGGLRRRRRLAVPLCAPITDFADFAVWAHPGADLHLVVHPAALAWVEAVAGPGSATLARPPVARAFRAPLGRADARATLGLPGAGALVAVSGGGWGVGDLEGAAAAALRAGAPTVLVLAGRDAALLATLRERFAADARVHVLGFTERMDAVLRAADVLVHSTGGMTSLEALSCGCPMIAYGSAVGHIRVHNRTLAALGLVVLAETRAELAAALDRRLGPEAQPPRALRDAPDPAALVAAVRARVRPLPAWRLGAERALVPALAALACITGLWTNPPYSLASRPLELRPVTRVRTAQPAVGLIVRAAPGATGPLATALAARGVHGSFASPGPPDARLARTLRALGDESLPDLPDAAPERWLRARRALGAAPRLGGEPCLLMPSGGSSFGRFLLARALDAQPIAGQVGPRAAARGDLVVATGAGVVAVVRGLAARGLVAVPVSALGSTNARTAGERSSTTADARTTTRPRARRPG
jgi:processive 1,2-diacylglycerol beta-glucosyltransferase